MASLRSRAAESLAAFDDVARNPGLRGLALAYTGSELGAWGYTIGVSVLVFRSGGANALGVLTLVLFVPPGLAAPFMSVLGDRLPRLRVMVVADLSRALLWALAAVVAFERAPIAYLYVIAALSGVAGVAFRPAQAASLPSLARTPEELTAANVVSSSIQSVTVFVGPAIAGVIVAATQPGVLFTITLATFLLSALLVGRLRPVDRRDADDSVGPRAPTTTIGRMLSAGAEAIARDASARVLITLIGAQTLVAGALVVFLPLLALGPLGIGERGLGSLWAALGVGGIVGALAAVGLVARRRLSGPFAAGTLLWGAPIALLAIWHTATEALLLVGVIGVANTVVDVASITILQRAVREAVLARVFGILDSVMYLTHAVGGIAAATLVSAFGVRPALIASGAFLPVVAAVTWRQIRSIDAGAEAPTRALELLAGVPFLTSLPPTTLESLALHAGLLAFPAESQVVTQGEHGDRFFVIADGTASVTVDGAHIGDLAAGDAFGEIALLRDVPRTGTVTSTSDLTLVSVARDEFLAAVTGHAATADAASALVEARLLRPLAGVVGW